MDLILIIILRNNVTKKYTKESLIAELHRFVRENGRVPRYQSMGNKNGYPSSKVYIIAFGTWNNALELAGFDINRYGSYTNKNNICDKCSTTKSTRWYYKNKNIICSNCYQTDRACISGNLNPNSSTGIGFIAESIVYTTLADCIKCNTKDNFCAQYDLISVSLGTINVKSSKLRADNNSWLFSKLQNATIPDNYVCIGFNSSKDSIQHVWIIPNNSSLIKPYGVVISNSKKILSKFKQYEVDPEPYNKVYQSLDIYTLLEFCNLKPIEA